MIEMTLKEAMQELEETIVTMKKLGLIENESRMLSAIIMGKNALERNYYCVTTCPKMRKPRREK